MSFDKTTTDDKDRNKIENDDMNIRSHLNTSLELKGISVSEELINKTLEAIKNQPAEGQKSDAMIIDGKKENTGKNPVENKKSGRVVSWYKYARIIAGAAAAVFVIAVGMNAVGGMKQNAKDMSTSLSAGNQNSGSSAESALAAQPPESSDSQSGKENAQNNSVSPAAKESATAEDKDVKKDTLKVSEKGTDTSGDTANNSADNSSGNTVTGKAASAAADKKTASNKDADDNRVMFGLRAGNAGDNDTSTDTPAAGGGGTVEDSKIAAKPGDGSTTFGSEITPTVTVFPNQNNNIADLSFESIFLNDYADAEYIKITDETDQYSITLTGQEVIKNFYTVMDQYQFTIGTQAPASLKYTIEAVSMQTARESYTLSVGDTVSVNYILGDVAKDSNYNCTDTVKLLADLDSFIKKNNLN